MTARHWLPLTLAIAATAAACGRGAPIGPTPSPAPSASANVYAPVALRISRFDAPAEATAGLGVTVTVTVVLPNACTEFGAVDAAIEGDRITFSARGSEAKDAVCAQILTFQPVAVTVTPTRSGTYTLVSADGEVATTMVVR